jgi:hypothetical protein
MFLTDPLTEEKFIPKRTNQKFSCRKNQVAYNNLIARRKRKRKMPFDKALEQNRTILERILKDNNEITVSKDFLLGAEFDFQFFNRGFVRGGVNYQCVYEYAFTLLENGKYKIYKMK